jgi:hypothetical protein
VACDEGVFVAVDALELVPGADDRGRGDEKAAFVRNPSFVL